MSGVSRLRRCRGVLLATSYRFQRRIHHGAGPKILSTDLLLVARKVFRVLVIWNRLQFSSLCCYFIEMQCNRHTPFTLGKLEQRDFNSALLLSITAESEGRREERGWNWDGNNVAVLQ